MTNCSVTNDLNEYQRRIEKAERELLEAEAVARRCVRRREFYHDLDDVGCYLSDSEDFHDMIFNIGKAKTDDELRHAALKLQDAIHDIMFSEIVKQELQND